MDLAYITDASLLSVSQLSTERLKMKCLVLLLAVAVCQGAILRERSFQKHKEVPEVDERIIQKLHVPSRQLKVSFTKKPVQLLQKPVELVQTPWTQSTKPNFLEYINLFNKQSWQLDSWTNVFDYNNFRDLIQFPGSEFLQEEIDKYIRNLPVDTQLPLNDDIVKDYHNLVMMLVTKLEDIVPKYTEIIRDPSTLAQLITRDVVKMILEVRMQCSTTTWDKYFIERVQNQLLKTMHQTQHQLLENFQSWLPQVMPVEREMIDQLVQEFTLDVQQHLYKDVMQYVHGVGFKDIAIVSHKLYPELKQLFKQSWNRDTRVFMEQLIAMVTDVVATRETCPRQQDFDRKTKLACWDFQNLFLEREVANLHSRVQNLIHKIQYRPCMGEECKQYRPCIGEECTQYIPCIGEECTQYRPCIGEECTQYRPCIGEECTQYRPCIGEECKQYNWNFPQTFKLNYPRVFQRTYPQSHKLTYPEFYPRMNEVCKRTIKLFVETVFQNAKVCQLSEDTTDYFQNYQMLEPKEIEYMKTLLKPVWNPLSTIKDRQL